MIVTTRQRGEVTVLDVAGGLTIGDGQRAFRSAVEAALDGGSRALLVHCGALLTIDSTGMGALVKAYTAASRRGARLSLCCLPAATREILRRMHMLSVIDTYRDEDTAIASFAEHETARRARS